MFAITPVYAEGGEPESQDSSTAELSGGSSNAFTTIGGNPWGCKGKSHWPHESTDHARTGLDQREVGH